LVLFSTIGAIFLVDMIEKIKKDEIKNKVYIGFILIVIFSSLSMLWPYLTSSSARGGLRDYAIKNIDDNTLVIADARIYRGEIAWMFNDKHYIEASLFQSTIDSLKNIPQWIKYNHFTENILPYDANLSYMLHVCFDNSPGRAVMFAFPDLNLEPHYFSNVPKGYWQNKENVKAVSKEFLEILTNKEGKYRFTEEELQQYLTPKLYAKPILPFRKKLNGLLVKGLGNDPKKVERFI